MNNVLLTILFMVGVAYGQTRIANIDNRESNVDTRGKINQGFENLYNLQVDVKFLEDNAVTSGGVELSSWSIIVIPDLQDLFADPAPSEANLAIADGIFDWIIDNQVTYNIKMVITTGDLTHHNGSEIPFYVTVPDDPEYIRVKERTDRLDSAGIPFLYAPGNHEYDQVVTPLGTVGFNKYMPDTRFKTKPWYGGQFEDGIADNVYYELMINGQQYLFFGLEYTPRLEVLEWVNSIIYANKDSIVFYATHYYLAETGGAGQGVRANPDGVFQWDNCVSLHDNITAVFSGHVQSGAAMLRSMTPQMSMCTQFMNDYSFHGSEGAIQVVNVNSVTGSCMSRIYRTNTDTWDTVFPAVTQFDLAGKYGSLDDYIGGYSGNIVTAGGTLVFKNGRIVEVQ